MAALTLRVRGPSGQSTLSLPAGGTVAELTAAVAERTGVELARLELRSGFPLRVLEWRSADAAAAAAAALGLQPGDSLQASESVAPAAEPAPTASDAELLSDGSGFAVQRRIMASDNSCLFRAVAYLSSQGGRGRGRGASELRRVVADAVLADPERFSEPVLGKSPADYAAWILLDDSWGGAIELAILSEKLGFEICAADVQTQRVDRYGQGNYKERGWVLYDGIHYDAIAVAAFPDAPEAVDLTMQPVDAPNAEAVDRAVAALVTNAHRAHKYTDTAGFTLRCIICREGMQGQAAAVAHAKATGHDSFGEYH